jgi:4-carboxymuconolactone decarboxylase
MSRLASLALTEMNDAQRKVADAILKGPRGYIGGPFPALLRCPALADAVQRAGEYLRFSSLIPMPAREIAALVAAREWTSQFEWHAHRATALREGLDLAIVEAIERGVRPAKMSDDEAPVYEFCTELIRTRKISDAGYTAFVARFGEEGVVDITGALGYYVMIAMIMNVAEVSPKPADLPPLAPLETPFRAC